MSKYNFQHVGGDVHIHTAPVTIVQPAYCEIVCPGHHYFVGAGENLSSGIEWCPNVERADVSEMWDDED